MACTAGRPGTRPTCGQRRRSTRTDRPAPELRRRGGPGRAELVRLMPGRQAPRLGLPGSAADELYFLECGKHLAWGYPDQPPFVPLVARLMSDLAPGSLVILRLPSALAAGVLVLLTGLLTRELRGGRTAQVLACAVIALAPVVTGAEHLLSTTSFNLLVSALLCWLLLRILRAGDQRLWLAAGLAAGAGLLDTDLVAFLIFAVVVGLAVVGPRLPLRSGWFYAGGAIALAMWAAYQI